MPEISVEKMALSLREEYTSVGIKRSANIDNCAPEGYFNLIHAIALSWNDQKDKSRLIPVSNIREKYNTKIKNSKDIMENCGKLTYQPFPIVESTKKRSANSDETINSPLYDEATGNTVQERYSNVTLSDLGKVLVRHYLDKDLGKIESYNSIVPFSLLRKSMPWSMGHKSEMQPLNPSELFTIMNRMMELNSPFVEEELILKVFKGVDLGPNYTIYTNSRSLINLYARGEGSFIAVPEIDIRRKENKIIIKRPPLNSTTKKLVSYLRKKSVTNENEQYAYFKFSPKISMVGNEAHITVTKWDGNNKQIMSDFLNDSYISTKKYIRNTTILYKDNPKDRSSLPEDNILGEAANSIKLSDLGQFENDVNIKSFKELVDKYKLSKNKEEVKKEDTAMKYTSYGDLTGNPYNFILDQLPVFEVLWRCILGERNLLVIKTKEKLEKEKEQLEKDRLMEKATRPEVAQVIYELQPDRDREQKLLERTPEGSDLLKEGFQPWEVQEIYRSRGNNILPNLFNGESFRGEVEKTLRRIDELENKIANPHLFDEDIKKVIAPFINSEKYKRKTQVKIVPFILTDEEEDTRIKVKRHIEVNSRYDKLDLPTTLYWDDKQIRRNYGVNMYFNDFVPNFELNTTNYSKVKIFFSDDGKTVQYADTEVKKIPIDSSVSFGSNKYDPAKILGVVPIEQGTEFIMWTSKGRFFRYMTNPGNSFGLEPDEIIYGWEYLDKGYLDIRSEYGVLTVNSNSFPKFKKGLKDNYANFGVIYDMYNKNKADRIIRIRNKETNRDYKKTRRVMIKSKNANPIELDNTQYDSVFSMHRSLYFGGVFLKNRKKYGLCGDEQFKSRKEVYLKEYADIDDKSKLSTEIENNIRQKMYGKKPNFDGNEEAIMEYAFNDVISRYTKAYLDFDPNEYEKFNIIDERTQERINRVNKFINKSELTKGEYEDNEESSLISWLEEENEDNHNEHLEKDGENDGENI